jgi:hypothetical protein
MCSLMHVRDDKNSLGFVNPTQINQLELKPVVNEKSEMFKGMSNKKWATTKNCPKTKEILHEPT